MRHEERLLVVCLIEQVRIAEWSRIFLPQDFVYPTPQDRTWVPFSPWRGGHSGCCGELEYLPPRFPGKKPGQSAPRQASGKRGHRNCKPFSNSWCLCVKQKNDPRLSPQQPLSQAVAAATVMTTAAKIWKRKMVSKWSFKDLNCGRDFMTLGLR